MRLRALTIIATLCALALVPSAALAAPKKAFLKFSATSYSVAENAGTFNVTVQRSGNTRIAASVDYSDNGTGTAAGGGVDYLLTSGTLNFAAGEAQKTFPVTIVDNTTANAPNKTVVVKLSNASAGAQIKTQLSTLTIIDNEGPGTIDFSASSYTVLESGGFATVTVNRAGATNLSVSVDYATQTALTNPATAVTDYTPISPPQTLTFAAGEMSKTFQVAITDDSNAESPENVNLVLSNPQNLSGGAAPQIGPNSPAVLTINDDDVSTFSFSSRSFSVAENDPVGHATITVTRGGATNIPASVNYATSDGTATAGQDYTATSGTINFAAGETQKTFTVDITNDVIAEVNETVNLTLTSGLTTVATSLLSIVDNDNPLTSVQLADPAYSVNEADGTATVTVTLSHPVDADVTVDYATADGTATTAGPDYTDTHGTLTFIGNNNNGGPGTGQTSRTIQIPITQDILAEDNETFTMTLSNVSPGTAALAGAPSSAPVTIVDDDPPGSLQFKSLHYDVNETGGEATITVERIGGVGGTVSVDYATSDGTARADSDYTAATGTLTWAPGDNVDKTFTVPVTWDGRGEGPESVNLTLSNAVGGDLGTNNAAVLRIADDGASGPLGLSSSSYSVGEADGLATITVTRSGGSLGGPVSVDYATSDGSAAAGSDYTAVSGTLTFGPGESTKSFTVPVTSDSAHEDAETFQVALSNPAGGASLNSPAGATVTIVDDDAAPVNLQSSPAKVNPADKTPPKLTLSAKAIQRVLKAKLVALTARCNEACTLKITAKIGTGKKAIVFGRATARAASGKTTAVKVKLSKRALANLRKMLKAGKVNVVVAVTATDAAGNKAAGSRKVTVKA